MNNTAFSGQATATIVAPYRIAIEDFIRRSALPVDKYSHQPRVYQLALRIAEDLIYDDEVLHAAAWLHDIGVFIGHRPEDQEALATWDNVAYATELVPELLTQFGFPAQKIPAVVAAIRHHLPSSAPVTTEGILLRDADILETLGAIGILRTVSKVGRDTRYPTFAPALALLKKNCTHLSESLHLLSARRLATHRIQVMLGFFDALDVERDGVEL
ncbi:MAG: HD domain-containing protein [Burkholderiaceae bacterium]|nr:HD domain-containing protein [Burkholderiaceae bacterium]